MDASPLKLSSLEEITAASTVQKVSWSDGTTTILNFESNWKKEKKLKEIEIQTDPISVESVPTKETQIPYRDDKEIQTDPEVVDTKMIEDNSTELQTFLKIIYPIIQDTLQKNLRSKVFDDYGVNWEDEVHNITCQYELMPTPDHSPVTSPISATAVSWNSNGSSLAVSYGRLDHDGWCDHTGMLGVWSIFSRKLNPKKPQVLVDTPNCLMCVEFHPEEPSLLAGGTYNGQILVWDLTKGEDPLIAATQFTDDSHYESVCKVIWIKSSTKKGAFKSYQLASTGSEGKLLVWDLVEKTDHSWKLELSKSFLLSLKTRGKGVLPTGGTSMCSNSMDESVFVCGTESGRLFKCSLSTTSNEKEKEKRKSINPITFAYEPHIGPVYAIDYSPFHRNLFLSAGCDTHIRLYNVLKKSAIFDLVPSPFYLFSIQWCPFRPLLFAAACGDGRVYFYDLKKSKAKAAAVLEVATSNWKASVQTCRFNPTTREYFATGDSRGVVKVWLLNNKITQEDPMERQILEKFGGKDTKAGKGEEPEGKAEEEKTENE